MKRYFVNGIEISEQEAKAIEQKNQGNNVEITITKRVLL